MEITNNLFVCPNNHYYDGSTHTVCPYCGEKGTKIGSASGGFQHTEAPNSAGAVSSSPAQTPNAGGSGVYRNPAGSGAMVATEDPMHSGGGSNRSAGPTIPSDNWNAPGGVVNPYSAETILGGDLAPAGHMDPTVGWLVCIDGPVRGTDWRLHAGYNYIGREVGDIHIQGDSQISRSKHAMVAYHNKNRTYYVGPAEGRNIIEVNGEPVFNAVRLNSHDVITVGTTKLMFVPLCGEKFAWDQEKKDV